ncbi:MAG TPA: energy transducer TonB [Gemmatimonadales bacterium]|nr:energy transducer TonB [Gemmatimonadales bacterium]
MNFFTLPAGGAVPVALPTPPPLAVASLPALARIKVDVPPLTLPHDSVTASTLASAAGLTGAGQPGPPGTGAGQGPGTGAGAGSGPGTGTGGGGDYICASPRTMLVPPLANVPGSVAGRTYRIRFWVRADGRVTRVEIDPPIADEAYRREFLERMQAYLFTPPRAGDGRNGACVVTVPLRIGH